MSDRTRASLELLYHVSRELTTALDLRTLLQRILFLSLENVGGERGSLVVLDERGQAVDAAIVYGAQLHSHTTRQLRETVDRGLAGWVLRNRKSVLVLDTSQDERWLHRPDDDIEHTGAKSAICVPIQAREDLVGVLTVVHPKPGFFNVDHLALIQAIADQAGTTVLNARLYADSQRQARVMTALAETATAINASLELDEVLQLILDQTCQALQAQAVVFGQLDPEQKEIVIRAVTGKQTGDLPGTRLAIGQGVIGRVAETGQGLFVGDAHEDPANHLPGIDIRSCVAAAVQSQGQRLGVLQAINAEGGEFDAEALSVLTGIASLAGTAIHNAQLYERLRATQQRYQELFEDSIDPILVTDLQGNIQEANRPAIRLSGLSEDALRAVSIRDLHQVDAGKIGENFAHLALDTTVSYESLVKTKERGDVPVQVYVRRVDFVGEDSLQWIFRDISEHKALDVMRDDLMAMIYHDLRSPLANVISGLDMLQALLPLDQNQTLSTVFGITTRSTERVQRLVNSLLDIHRLEAGQPVANQQAVPPESLIQDAVEAVKPQLNNKRQNLSMQIESSLPLVWVDADMIRRVVINLLENAVKFSPTDSDVQVGARRLEGQVEVWVQDHGPGIPPENRERIFNKFTRLQGANTPKGLGLGLAFCRLAVQAHGGKIWVESQPEQGSRFVLTLPVTGA